MKGSQNPMQAQFDMAAMLTLAAKEPGVPEALEADREAGPAMLRRICERATAGEPLEDLPLQDEANFALLRGAATAMREAGRHEAEAVLWREAHDRRPWPLFQRRLSIALLRVGRLAEARAAADEAIAKDPEGTNDRFERHLDDLAGAEWLIEELRAEAAVRRAPPRDARVAYCLHNSLPHAAGGYALRSHALANEIGRAGRPLHAVVRPGFPSDGAAPDAEIEAEARIDHVAYRFENGFGRRGRSYGYLRDATDYFERTFEALEIGIVHAATNFWTALPAALAARRLGLPFVYEVRSFWSVTREAEEPGFRSLPQARRDDLLEELTLALSDRVLALNSAMAGELATFGVDPRAVTIVPNCVDIDKFRPGPRDPALAEEFGIGPDDIVIGYIGAMRDYEGLDLLIDAAAALSSDNPSLRLLIFGADPARTTMPGTVEHALAERIAQSGGEAIRLLPPVDPGIVPALYRCFDVCAYPRRGFAVTELVPPLKPLEAMASGKPVLLSDVGGMRDLVRDGRSALVCAKDDAASLRDALDRLVSDTELRDALGETGRRFVSTERRWHNAAETVEAIYAGLGETEDTPSNRSPLALLDTLFGPEADR